MKSRRQRKLVRLLRDHDVTSQRELVGLLRKAGFPATQATVSRDLDDLGAIKVRREGRGVYALPDEVPVPEGEALRRILMESVLELEASHNIVVVRTPPGHASMVASAIDRSRVEGVAGSVAGDDTVMVICRQAVPARRIERRLRSMAEAISMQEAR